MLLQANRLINKVWLLFLKNSGMPRLFVHGQPALITPYISGCQLLLKRFRAHSYEAGEAWDWWEIQGVVSIGSHG